MPNRRITANIRAKISELVNLHKEFLPLSSRSRKTITFKTIFAESKVDQYLDDDIKTKALQKGWEDVIRRHPRLPYTLIRKIVPASIDYRKHKRNPLTRAELDKLIDCLLNLGFDMREELSAIELDESIPEIQVPPAELVKRLESHPLASEMASEPLVLFKNGHFNEAVRKAAEKFEVYLQSKAKVQEHGKSLMAKVFRPENPIVKLNSLQTENERNIQQGYQLMTMGMMQAIRNVFSHGDEGMRSPEECYEMLMFINWLFRTINS